MVREALTNYLALASGLTEVTRQRARSAARALAAQGEATVEQVSGLAQEILETSRSNRSALVSLVRYEIDRALSQVGLATAEDLSGLQRRVAELEKAVRELTAAVAEYEKGAGPAAVTEPPPRAAKAVRRSSGAAAGKAAGRKAAGNAPAGKLDAPKKAPKKAPAKARRVKAAPAPAGSP